MSPGKLAFIIGASGTGKTTTLEHISDLWAIAGEGGLYYGPEFDANEMFARKVQRYGGVKTSLLRKHHLFMRDVLVNTPDDKITGELLPPDVLNRSKDVARKIALWPGRLEYVNAQPDVERMLEVMGRSVEKRRSDGEEVTFAIFDYAQMMIVQNVKMGENAFEFALQLIKDWVIEYRLVGVVGSQVTKVASLASRDNVLITPENSHSITEQKCNLWASINLETAEGPRGEIIRTNRCKWFIAKNSDGVTGVVKMLADFPHLKWIDKSW